jgi:hypothetical protein
VGGGHPRTPEGGGRMSFTKNSEQGKNG